MKKTKLFKVLPLTLLLVLAGCGGKDDGSDQSHVDTQDGEQTGGLRVLGTKEKPVNIKFSHRNAQTPTELIDTFIAEFNAIPGNENIKITNNKVAGNYNNLRDQVVADFGTGEYPDLVECYPDHVVRYMDSGKPVNLESYMNDKVEGWSDADKEDMIPAFMEEGHMYPIPGTFSLPLSKSTEAMFYNERVLFDPTLGAALHGIDDTIPALINADYLNGMTWEDMFEHLAPAIMTYNNDTLADKDKIIKTSEEHYGVLGYDSDDNFFITLCEQYGYGYTDIDQKTGKGVLKFNNENVRALLKKFNGYSNKHYLSTQGICNSYINNYFTKNAFLFSIGSTAGYKYQQQNFTDQVGVANIPHAKDHDLKVINQGPSVCVLSHPSDNPKEIDKDRALAAWRFYKFMAEKDQNIRWATATGYLPVRSSVLTDEAYFEYCNEEGRDPSSVDKLAARTSKYCSTVMQKLFANVTFKGSSTARDQVGSLMTVVLKEATATCTDEWVKTQFDKAVNNIKLEM